MDFDSTDGPPIASRRHNIHNTRRRSLPGPSTTKRASVPPASPEVISNLITSLSVIAKPVDDHFESSPSSLSLPATPGIGSFGVDYGAYSHSNLNNLTGDPISLDELAACPPVIRTAKPPSGFSPLTAAKSPKTTSPTRESGLRSFIRNSTSRPSSKGSGASKHDDTSSIGNLSIERSGTTPELKTQRSQDSWGKKTGRSQMGLMYMSSKERLREREMERRRGSGGGLTPSPSGGLGVTGNNHNIGRPDPFLAETAIHEEPPVHHELPIERHSVDRVKDGPRPIPARDSSLRKPVTNGTNGTNGTHGKRSSGRRSRRDIEGSGDVIIEGEEHRPRESSRRNHEREHKSNLPQPRSQSYDHLPGTDHAKTSNKPSSNGISGGLTKSTSVAGRSFLDIGHGDDYGDDEDDGAPFPAVAQNRRRSGATSPIPPDGNHFKRSSSRLKRLSGQRSPQPEEHSRDPSAEPPHSNLPSGYERPQSADSVDDAVESYLCSPRLSQKIRHPQTGRIISFSEVGDSEGSAVFCCVGMGLTRYITAFYDELALTLKLRLITPDRPGVGDSESYSDGTATPLSWPGKLWSVRVICSH